MTYYLNNSEYINNKLNSSNGTTNNHHHHHHHSALIESTNKATILNYFNNDNYDFDINYSPNANALVYSYRQSNVIDKSIVNSKLLPAATVNEVLVSGSSSDNDDMKPDIDLDDIDDLNVNIMNTTIISTSNSTTSSTSSKTTSSQYSSSQLVMNLNECLNMLLVSYPSTSKLDVFKCKYLNKFFNYYNSQKLNKFEDLQMFFAMLRKTLNKMRIKQDLNELYSLRRQEHEPVFLAFDNLTYSSSVEDLPSLEPLKREQTDGQNEQKGAGVEALSKKTLKSIKRKDKLKKETKANENTSIVVADERRSRSRSRTRSKQEGTDTDNEEKQKAEVVEKIVESTINSEDLLLSNKEFEKQLRRKYRCKSVARSIRRAKTVYYRNRRSKSLENMSALALHDLKLKFPDENEENLSRMALSKANSIMSSCSSFTSVASAASDISSSYFHELSDWSPNFSDSDSIDSNSISLEDVDWEANLHDIPLTDYYSSTEEDLDEDNDDNECECKFCTKKAIDDIPCRETQLDSFKFIDKKYNVTFHVLENMLTEVMCQMLNVHPGIFPSESVTNCPVSIDFLANLPITQIHSQYLIDNKGKLDCSICLASFEMKEDVISLPCSHTYHAICVKVWLSKSATCPICRSNYSNYKCTTQVTSRETLI